LEVIAAFLGLLTGVALTWFSSQSNRQEATDQTPSSFEVDVTRSVRADRIETYRALWKVIEPLSKEWKIDRPAVPFDTIRAKLRHWYYNDGGIFLTAETQQTFWALQDALEAGNEIAAYEASHDLRAATRKEVWSEEALPATEEVRSDGLNDGGPSGPG
jgi:hypothetical protein